MLPWLTLKDLCKHLSISKATAYRLTLRPDFPKHKLGSDWRFHVSEVDDWLRNKDGIALSSKKTQQRDYL